MAFHQTIEETMSEVLCHMLKRTDKVKTEDQLAIGQEYREWINAKRIKPGSTKHNLYKCIYFW